MQAAEKISTTHCLAGLGLRRELMDALDDLQPGEVDFMEVAPENWIGIGGKYARRLQEFSERYPIFLHGLSLNVGGVEPIDVELVKKIGDFIERYQCPLYSEHLSYCADHGHLYDLMPIPFTDEAVHYVAGRVRQVQDILQQNIVLENVSYYAAPDQALSEQDFLVAVLEESGADLLLDVNNVYVNSINHSYDASEFLVALPANKVRYNHIAGHYVEAEDLRVDTHGAAVIDPVWRLLDESYRLFGVKPTLLERDFNFPPLRELTAEVDQIRQLQLPYLPDSRPVS